VNSQNGFGHHDNTINIAKVLLLLIFDTWSWYGVTTAMLVALKSPQLAGQLSRSSHNLSTTSYTCAPDHHNLTSPTFQAWYGTLYRFNQKTTIKTKVNDT